MEEWWLREMDFAAALAWVPQLPDRELPGLPPGAQPALALAIGPEQSAEPVVFATVAAAQAALPASAQIIARTRPTARCQKSRPAQPSAIEFAYTIPAFSNENLFLSIAVRFYRALLLRPQIPNGRRRLQANVVV